MADATQLVTMTCGGCERAVTRALPQLPGVQATRTSAYASPATPHR
jgi:copper chaperone CopZ